VVWFVSWQKPLPSPSLIWPKVPGELPKVTLPSPIDSNVTDDEIGSLVNAFNKMTKELRSNRQELELSARKLTQQNQEIEERRQYMEIVLKNVSAGVVTLDAEGIITTLNKSAEQMLSLEAEQVLDKHYKDLLVT
jgi:two-component system nitrogen regulation sensor histidine kinase NtrY